MQTFLIIASLLLGIAAIGCTVALAVKAIRKKPVSRFAKITAALYALAVICLVAGGSNSTTTFLMMIGLAAGAVSLAVILVGAVRWVWKGKPKTLIVGCVGYVIASCAMAGSATSSASTALQFVALLLLVLLLLLGLTALASKIAKRPAKPFAASAGASLVLAIALFVASGPLAAAEYEQRAKDREIGDTVESVYNGDQVKTTVDFEVVDGTEPIEVEGYQKGTETKDGTIYHVYDAAHLNLLFPDEVNATAEDCLRVLESNKQVDSRFKTMFAEFIRSMGSKYPDASFAVLHHNLSTLKVEELDSMAYTMKSLSSDSSGCYVISENAIYIPRGTEYVKEEWGYQVIVHEFCHMARSWREPGGFKSSARFADLNASTNGYLVEECMNTIFSCSLLDYDEPDLAYRVPSNYLTLMLEYLQGKSDWTLTDYMNQHESYFLRDLDQAAGYTNYAKTMWRLIALQREDMKSDKIDIPAEEYEPIADYLCEMYFKGRITPGMSYQQAEAVADELVGRAFYGASDYQEKFAYRYYDNAEAYLTSLWG